MGVSSPTGKKRRKQFAVGKNRDLRDSLQVSDVIGAISLSDRSTGTARD